MNWFYRLLRMKDLTVSVTKPQEELLEIFLSQKEEYDRWRQAQPLSKVRFQFFYPTAVEMFYDEFKLFTAYFKRTPKGQPLLTELKMTETNYDVIRCASWKPFEQQVLEFLTTLEESKKVALFEKRKMLYEYEALCVKGTAAEGGTQTDYPGLQNSLSTA